MKHCALHSNKGKNQIMVHMNEKCHSGPHVLGGYLVGPRVTQPHKLSKFLWLKYKKLLLGVDE